MCLLAWICMLSQEEILVYLCLARLALMARDSDLVEDAMELRDNVVDLGGQVACIYRHWKHQPLDEGVMMTVTSIKECYSNWRQNAWQSKLQQRLPKGGPKQRARWL